MTPTEIEFHCEEYRQIRAEVTEIITKTETLLQSTILIAAAVYAWLATDGKSVCATLPPYLPWGIPFAAVIVVGFLGGARYLQVKEMGLYLRKLEDALGSSLLGWEKFLAGRPPTVPITSVLAWVVMLCATAYIAWKVPCP